MACRSILGVCNRRNRCGRMVKRNLLLVLMVMGAVVGFVIGATINDPVNRITDPEKKATVIMLINFPGELFMNMLKMIILPLVVASLITAVSTLNPDVAGRIGRRTLIYYVSTMVLAALLGLTLVMAIRPGLSDDHSVREDVERRMKYRNLDSLLDMIRNCFPSNLVEAAISQKKTRYVSVPASFKTYNVTEESINLGPDEKITAVHTNGTINITTTRKELHAGSDTVPAGMMPSGGMNILGLTMFSIVLGIVLGKLREKGRPLVEFFSTLNEAIMIIVVLVMCAATLPTTIRCVEENNSIDPRISRFMLPLGATLNMDGVAIARVVTTIFIAQLNNIPLSPGRIAVICLMAVALSFGAAGIPGGGIMQIIILQAVSLPLHDMGLILAVDWFLDRSVTTVNVLGDAMGTGIVQHLSRDDLKSQTGEDDAIALKQSENEPEHA